MNTSHLEDRVLVERSKRGDTRAFDRLLERHKRRAYQFAMRLTRDPEEAGDVVAETLVRMFNAISNFKENSSFTAWMYRITTNCFLDMKKRARRRIAVSIDATGLSEDGEAVLQIEDKSPSAYDVLVAVEELEALQAAVRRLPDVQRQLLVMHISDMRTCEEMSALLDIPIGTIKSRLHRARRNLLLASGRLSPSGAA